MNKNILKINIRVTACCFALSMFTLLVTSCDDFLDESPKHELVETNVVTDYSTAQHILNGIYAQYATDTSIGDLVYGYLSSQAGVSTYFDQQYRMSYNQRNFSAFWSNFYTMINVCNAAVNGIEKLDVEQFPSETIKNQMLGEAKCLRGFFYLNMLWLYTHWFDNADSPYGLLYKDQVSNLSNMMVGRKTVGESYQLVLDDIEFAEQYAPEFWSPRYVSKQFAQILHVKLLLNRGWEGDYQQALQIVNDVMQKTPSSWKMEPDVRKLYEDAWDSQELLFGRYIGKNDITSTVGSNVLFYSYELYWANHSLNPIAEEWIKADPRYEYTFGTAGGPIASQSTIQWNDVCTKLYHGGRVVEPDAKYCTYLFRYAELYLMKAELLARTNPSDIQGALKPLNDMRASYTTPKLEPITVNSYDELMDAIYKEYIVTLLYENETAWFVSTRFTHNGRPWVNILKPDVNFTTNQYCWPIPDAEITNHSNEIQQNPGLE